jgi:2-polyprenyl-6-methoxyphenol hydroxylase-like FAD-dependent oxidoreductase
MIVGAGPVGLTLACDLARRGVPFHIIDRSEAPSTLSRSVGLQARTLQALDDLGLADAFLENGTVVTAVRIYSNGRLHQVFELKDDPREEVPYPCLLIVEQHVTESILAKELARLGATVDRGVDLRKLSDELDQVRCWLHTSSGEVQARCSYLVGCDGPNSTVRRLRQFQYSARASDLLYYVADVELDWALPAQEIVWLVAGESEVVAVPLPGRGRYRLNLWKAATGPLAQPAFGALETPLDLSAWRSTLERLAPCDVNLLRARSSLAYRTGYGIAESFQEGRIFLAGDAAHAMPHCTAQGLNLGLQDACSLGWRLALVVAADAPPELLRGYQLERRPAAQATLSSMINEPSLLGRAGQLESREALERWSGLRLVYGPVGTSKTTVLSSASWPAVTLTQPST